MRKEMKRATPLRSKHDREVTRVILSTLIKRVTCKVSANGKEVHSLSHKHRRTIPICAEFSGDKFAST